LEAKQLSTIEQLTTNKTHNKSDSPSIQKRRKEDESYSPTSCYWLQPGSDLKHMPKNNFGAWGRACEVVNLFHVPSLDKTDT